MSSRGPILVTGGAECIRSHTARALGAVGREVVVLDSLELGVAEAVISATEAVTGRPVPYEIVDRRPGDPIATFVDPTIAERILGWRARYGLDEIIRTADEWHRGQD